MLLKSNGLGLVMRPVAMAFCLFGSTLQVMAQPTLRITSPTEGAVAYVGRDLAVTVEASPANAFRMVTVIGGDPIGFSRVLEAPPYTFMLSIPEHIQPRDYIITADGVVAPGKGASSRSVSIHVERPDMPVDIIPGGYGLTAGPLRSTSLAIYRSLRLAEVGWSEMIYVVGVFPDREEVDLTESSFLKYSSDNERVVKVVERGTVVSTGIGSANIMIRYRNKLVVLPVKVGRER
jgi:hypothetical protein